MKRLVYILLIMMCGTVVYGQQLPIYSQYLYNKFLINPAVAGSDGFTSFSLTARQQWVGYAGAPHTFSLTAQTRLLKKQYKLVNSQRRSLYRPQTDGKVGMGGMLFSDVNGLVKRTGLQYTYSYHTWIYQETQLSFGLSFTGAYYKIDEKQVDFEDPNDPMMDNELRKGVFIPDATFGAYLLNRNFSVGFSADQLFGASVKIGNQVYEHLEIKRHYYLFGNYIFNINNTSSIEPSVLVAVSEQFDPQFDIGVTYMYGQSFWGGLSFRTSGALIASLGVKYENIFLGYSFDFTLNEIQTVTYGTHEITVALKFGDTSRRYRWLDRY